MKTLFFLLFPSQFKSFKKNWRIALANLTFRRQIIFTSLITIFLVAIIPYFFRYIQSVRGLSIHDKLLNSLPVQNLSLYIFILIYAVILLSAINLSVYPQLLLKCVQAYCLLIFIRMTCLYLVPLEPDQAIIPLEDPFVGRLFYRNDLITKDLFFSGHVSTMALITLAIPFRSLKIFFIISTIVVASFILVQHVHYTIDVVVAPFFSWVCYRVIFKRNKWYTSYK